MKVIYRWRESDTWNDGILRPNCDFSEVSESFKGLVFNLLLDDEGHGLEYLSNWIDEGVIEVEKIYNGTLDFYDMWGHAWGAEISKENVLIYWGYDDTEREENMSFESFYTILREWSQFLKTEPNETNIVEFEC